LNNSSLESDDRNRLSQSQGIESSPGEQRSNDLGLFEHDDISAAETEGTVLSTSEAETMEGELSESLDDDSEEYLPADSIRSTGNAELSISNGSDDLLDFLSPNKRKAINGRDCSSRLSDGIGRLSFSTKE
jgi:hypothetical protein